MRGCCPITSWLWSPNLASPANSLETASLLHSHHHLPGINKNRGCCPITSWLWPRIVTTNQESTLTPQIHRYTPIQDNNTIRTLLLHPGEEDDPLVGELREVDVDDASGYTALSYVWGDVTRSGEFFITCDGKVLRITRSLDYALRGVRHVTDPSRLWADQVCINQDDLMERSHQVRFMGKIYEHAQLVHAWLGPDLNSSAQTAFALIRRLRETFDSPGLLSEFTKAQNTNVAQFENKEFHALRELYDLPWFNRVWICQEIGTAALSLLQWGNATISWDMLHRVSRVLDKNHRRLRVYMSLKVQRVTYLHRRFVDDVGAENPRKSFAYELSRGSHNLSATDPRDHVFSKLGHYSARSRDTGIPIMEADYTKSVSEIYLSTATELLKEGTSLEVLHTVYTTCLSTDDIPSWVPRPHLRAPSWVLGDSKTIFAATKGGQTVQFLDLRTVQIKGLEIDIVAYCSQMLPTTNGECRWFGNKTKSEKDGIMDWWFHLSGLPDIDTTVMYPNGELLITAFCQTLSAGCFYLAVKKGHGVGYHDSSSTRWLSHGASYLLDVLGNETAAHETLKKMSTGGNGALWADGANSVTDCRRLFRTAKGFYGLGPPLIENGDIICVLFGGKTPFCLRRIDNHYELIGECYLFGFMNCEAIDMMEKGELQQKSFCLK